MNKKILILLNAILFIAVIILYYLHFTSVQQAIEMKEVKKDTIQPLKFEIPQNLGTSNNILFINADTLFAKYEYVKSMTKDLQARQASIEGKMNEKGQKFQQDYAEYQQKISTGAVTEEQARLTEEDLLKRKNDLDQMEQQLNKLAEENQKNNLRVQKQVTDFFKEYSKEKGVSYVLAYTSSSLGSVMFANDSLDVTKQVIDALNTTYKNSKKK
jgi:outer membrane protein